MSLGDIQRIGNAELDQFLTAMLRAVGGKLTIVPSDGIQLEGEYIEVYRYADPDRIVYELKYREPEPAPPAPLLPPSQPWEGAQWTDRNGVTWTYSVVPIGWHRRTARGEIVWLGDPLDPGMKPPSGAAQGMSWVDEQGTIWTRQLNPAGWSRTDADGYIHYLRDQDGRLVR